MSELVENERTKLLANALDRASTAILTIGVVAPVSAALYTLVVPPIGPGWFVAVALVWIFAGIGLHISARLVLGALRE
jgi:hypothetical protein